MRKFCILLIIVIPIISFSQQNKIFKDKGVCDFIPINNYNNYIKKLGMYSYILPKNKIKVEASSFLKDKKYSYPVKNVIDGNLNTSWVEGVDGFGKGEWIKLTLDLRKVKGFTREFIIVPGYGKSESLFKKNNRLKSIIFEDQSNGYKYRYSFKDKYGYHAHNTMQFGSEKCEIKIYIEDVYKGSKYDDTCIGEIIIVMYHPKEGPDTSPL